ncbi:MAG: carbohydrate binding domain-containing protein [Brevinematales bacterium]|nr:carbohydrate binding domain-containing protein [Brevinematales bacterium]
MKKIGKKILILFLIGVVNFACTSREVKKEQSSVNILKNGNFSGLKVVKHYPNYSTVKQDLIKDVEANGYWQVLTGETDFVGEATNVVEDGVFKIIITKPGKEVYSVQLIQLPTPIKFGKTYTVKFDAKADKNRTIMSKITKVGDDWVAYSGERFFNITTEFKTYSYSFKSQATDSNARFEFNFGKDNTTTYIANVSIVEE